jgi:hypothetical protein
VEGHDGNLILGDAEIDRAVPFAQDQQQHTKMEGNGHTSLPAELGT